MHQIFSDKEIADAIKVCNDYNDILENQLLHEEKEKFDTICSKFFSQKSLQSGEIGFLFSVVGICYKHSMEIQIAKNLAPV